MTPEPRITDPAHHPRTWIGLTVAAKFLDMNPKSLDAYMDEGAVPWEWKGRRRKIHLDDLVRFKAALKRGARIAS